MYIIPAIDLIGGSCVRLIQGQYHRQINYEPNPVKQAKQFITDGADWLHIVDLEGAKIGKPVNTDSIKAIASLGKLKIEVGGGIRDCQSIEELLEIGVERVIIGTKAVTDFDWFAQMANQFKGRIVLGLDAKGSKISTEGWTKDHPQQLFEFAAQAAELPIAAIIYTDISKDGMMAGPNIKRTKALADAVSVPVIASGGVKEITNIEELKAAGGIEAVIVGRSLYEGTLSLPDAIKAAG